MLDLPKVQQQLRDSGPVADLILVASDSAEISDHVSKWLRNCLTEKGSNVSTLVRLFNGPAVEDEIFEKMLGDRLSPIATGLDFFVHEIRGKEPWVRKVLRPKDPNDDGSEWRVE